MSPPEAARRRRENAAGGRGDGDRRQGNRSVPPRFSPVGNATGGHPRRGLLSAAGAGARGGGARRGDSPGVPVLGRSLHLGREVTSVSTNACEKRWMAAAERAVPSLSSVSVTKSPAASPDGAGPPARRGAARLPGPGSLPGRGVAVVLHRFLLQINTRSDGVFPRGKEKENLLRKTAGQCLKLKAGTEKWFQGGGGWSRAWLQPLTWSSPKMQPISVALCTRKWVAALLGFNITAFLFLGV